MAVEVSECIDAFTGYVLAMGTGIGEPVLRVLHPFLYSVFDKSRKDKDLQMVGFSVLRCPHLL